MADGPRDRWGLGHVDLEPDRRYTIELHQESLGVAAHNYWVLRDSQTGAVRNELEGNAVHPDDPKDTPKRIGGSTDMLRFRQVKGSDRSANSKPILTFGADLPAKDVAQRWNNAVDAFKALNDKDVPYELLGGGRNVIRNTYDDEGHATDSRRVTSANSNGAAYTAGLAMGIPPEQMQGAVTGSGKTSPGFGRDLIDEFQVTPPPSDRGADGERGDSGSADELDAESDRAMPSDEAAAVPPLADAGDDTLRARFASKLLAPNSEAEEILLKLPHDWTEPELKTVMRSDLYWRTSDSLGRFANDQARAWHERVHGTNEMARRGILPAPPRAVAVLSRTGDGGDLRDGLIRLADALAARAGARGETGAVQDWQSALNALPRRRADGREVFVPILDVDGDFGPRTRFATKRALAGLGVARLLRHFGDRVEA